MLSNNLKFFKLNWFNSAVILISIIHILTINVSPIVWFDEVFFLDVSLSFLENGKFQLPMSPTYDKDILIYGPVYFFLSSLSIKLFGLGIFQFRFVNLLFGIFSILILKKILVKHYKVKVYIANTLSIFMFIHSIYHSNLHSGRMDLVALCLVLCGIFMLLNKEKFSTYFAGIFFSLALLTTPRIAVLLLGIPVFLLINLIQKRFSKESILLIFKLGVTVFGIYTIWFFYAFGSIDKFISYYNNLSHFVGGRPNIPLVMYPVFFIGFYSLFILFYKINNFKYYLSPLFVIPFIGILSFHFLVYIASIAYYALVIPFYLLLFSYVISKANFMTEVDIFNKKLDSFKIVIYPILSIYIIILIFKLSIISVSYKERNPFLINQFIKNKTKPNTILIGDYRYGYAAELNDLDFITYKYSNYTKINKQKFIDFVNNQPISYFMISDNSIENNEFAQDIIVQCKFEKIGAFRTEKTKLIQKIIELIPIKFDNNYNGVLYKREN